MKSDSLMTLCFSWFSKKEHLAVLFVAFFVFVSSMGVINASFLTRQKYASLQKLQQKEDELDSEYGRLLLEHSAWANYIRVEKLAGDELHMSVPLTEEMVIVQNN